MANTRQQRLDQKREQAAERQARWEALTPEQQLADLDRRGERAEKQRKAIKKLLDAEAAKKAIKDAPKEDRPGKTQKKAKKGG
jgi:hypothetical protein